MSALFSGTPKVPKIPPVAPPQNTQLDAELAALARRQGSAAALSAGPLNRGGSPNLLGHRLTGE